MKKFWTLYSKCRKTWEKLKRVVPFISLLSCLNKVYSEAPASLVFSGNTDKNVFAFLRMEVRNKINGRKK